MLVFVLCIDEKPMPGAAAVKKQDVRAYDEDSSDSEGEVKQKGRQKKRHHEETGKEMKQKKKKVRRSSPESSIEEITSSSLLSEVYMLRQSYINLLLLSTYRIAKSISGNYIHQCLNNCDLGSNRQI